MTYALPSRSKSQVVALCLSVATLLYARQIAMWAVPRNRFYTHWQRTDTLVLGVSLLGMALLLYLVASILGRAFRDGRVLRWLTIILLADILIGYAGAGRISRHAAVFTAGWAGLAGIGLYAASRPGSRLLHWGTTILAALAWLAPILLLQMLLWKPWDVRPTIEGSAPPQTTGTRIPVFLFLFDEWSFQRSYDHNQLQPFFRNLRKLASHSLEFTNAHSLAGSTNPSIPRFIFQRDGVLTPKNGVALWKEGDTTMPSAKLPSIFSAARARGYHTSLIGFYFPYRAILGDQVDHIVHQSYEPTGRRWGQRLLLFSAWNLYFLADPVSQLLWKTWNTPRVSENWVYINQAWRGFVRDLVRGSDANTFAMVHWTLPHGPFVLNEDGSYRGPFKVSRVEGTPEDYRRHLAFLDRVLGEAVEELDSAGLLDRALVIVTSDHSWKTETDSALWSAPEARTWVPLIVKLPHQTRGLRVPERFCLGQLGALLQRVMDTTLTERSAAEAVRTLPSSSPCIPPRVRHRRHR